MTYLTAQGEFCQPNLPEASNIENKELVRKIATRVVDGYVIQRENVDAIFNNLLAAETAAEEEARRQTDNDKTFASKGKQMRDAMRGAMQSPWTVGFISAWLYSYYKPSNIQSLVKKNMF